MWRKQVVASESMHPCRLSSLNLPAVQPPAQAPCAPPHLVTNLVDEQALNLRGGCRIDLQPACVCRGDVTAQHLLTNCDDTVQLRRTTSNTLHKSWGAGMLGSRAAKVRKVRGAVGDGRPAWMKRCSASSAFFFTKSRS